MKLSRLKCAVAFAMGMNVLAVAVASATPISTFDTDADGWTHAVGGDPNTTVAWSATGGQPGGCMIMHDVANGAGDNFEAPAKFTGDLSAVYGMSLQFDTMDTRNFGVSNNSLAIVSDLGKLVVGHGGGTANIWMTFSIPLNEGAGWKLGGPNGSVPTQAQFQSILSSVTSLQITGDLTTSADVTSLDNVRFVVPEPGTAGTLAAIFAGVVLRRKRARLQAP